MIKFFLLLFNCYYSEDVIYMIHLKIFGRIKKIMSLILAPREC